MQCPRCEKVDIEKLELGDVVIDCCPECGGIWFDHTELGTVAGESDGIRKVEGSIPPEAGESCDYLCPRCRVELRELLVHSNDEDFSIDRCPSCLGTWIDRRHLRKIEDQNLIATIQKRFSNIR